MTGSADIAVEWDANRRQAARLEALRERATREKSRGRFVWQETLQ